MHRQPRGVTQQLPESDRLVPCVRRHLPGLELDVDVFVETQLAACDKPKRRHRRHRLADGGGLETRHAGSTPRFHPLDLPVVDDRDAHRRRVVELLPLRDRPARFRLPAHQDSRPQSAFHLRRAVLGERVHVFIYANRELSEDEVREYCKSQVADYKVPDYITLSREPLPRNLNGKLVKAPLREKALEMARNNIRR